MCLVCCALPTVQDSSPVKNLSWGNVIPGKNSARPNGPLAKKMLLRTKGGQGHLDTPRHWVKKDGKMCVVVENNSKSKRKKGSEGMA